jgi:integrase
VNKGQPTDSFRACGKEKMAAAQSKHGFVKVFPLQRKGVESFVLSYHVNRRRFRDTFRGNLQAAVTRANEIEKRSFSTGAQGNLALAEIQVYHHAKETAARFGVSLSVAMQEYADARQRIGGRSLTEAADFFARQACLNMPQKTLGEVAQEMLDTKKKKGKTLVYLTGLRRCLQPACDALTKPITEISPADIDDHLLSLTLGTRSKKNVRDALVTLFAFAKGRGYLPNDRQTAASLSEPIDVKSGEIEIFTVQEMTALLAASDGEALPMIALGGFAGLRTAEIGRLEWKDVDFAQGIITVSAAKSKTASRRIVPIQPNLAQWLEPYAKTMGAVVKLGHLGELSRWNRMGETQAEVAKRAGVKWKRNGLRHSYGSYRLAQIKNASEVSLEMGNSPAMVFKHYRQLVTPRDAAAWWAITPKAS